MIELKFIYFSICSELQRIENLTNSPVISHLSETIQGVTTIRAYNQQARFTEILFKRLEANTIAFTILNTSNRWLGISLVSPLRVPPVCMSVYVVGSFRLLRSTMPTMHIWFAQTRLFCLCAALEHFNSIRISLRRSRVSDWT